MKRVIAVVLLVLLGIGGCASSTDPVEYDYDGPCYNSQNKKVDDDFCEKGTPGYYIFPVGGTKIPADKWVKTRKAVTPKPATVKPNVYRPQPVKPVKPRK